jgi:hypothetical protein
MALDNHSIYKNFDSKWYPAAKAYLEERVAKGEIEPKVLGSTLAAFSRRNKNYSKYGTPISYGEGMDTKVETALIKAVQKSEQDGVPLNRKKLKSVLRLAGREQQQSLVKQSPLTLDRELYALGNDFWEPAYRKDLNLQDVLRMHINMMGEHLAHVDTFGVNNELFHEGLAKAILWGQKNGAPVTDADILRANDILRASQRISLKVMNPTIRNVMNKVRATTNIMLLGLSALVSVPELIIIAMNTGGLNTIKAAGQNFKAAVGMKQGLLALEDLGLGIEHATNTNVNRISGDNVWSIGRVEEGFFRAIGLPRLQHILTSWAARSTDIYLKRSFADMIEGRMNSSDTVLFTEKLKQAGIQVSEFQNWKNQGYTTESDFYRDVYIPAINRLVKDTVVDPNPVDKPLWMADPRFMLISQLKGFMTVFTNRVMRNWWQETKSSPRGNIQLATHIAPYFAMYIAAQVAVQAVKEMILKGDLDDWDEKTVANRVLSAAGYAGGLGYFVDMVNHARWRMSPLGIVSPAVGIADRTFGDIVRAIEASDPMEAITKVLIKGLPTPFNGIVKEAMGYNE